MRLYGSRTSIVSRRESWMLKECTSRARNITATKNRNRARQDAKKEILESLAPIDSKAHVELSDESFGNYLFWEEHHGEVWSFDDDYGFDYCNSEKCHACCTDSDGSQTYSCIEESEALYLENQKRIAERAEQKANFIRRIEEALESPIRKISIEEVVGWLVGWAKMKLPFAA